MSKLEIQTVRVHCQHCMTMVGAAVKGDFATGFEGEPTTYFVLCVCPNCGGPLLAEVYEVSFDPLTGREYSNPIVRYPSRAVGVEPTWPEVLAKRFAEADTCFRSGAFNAAAVMCRRTMEQVCSELGASGRTLHENLARLEQQGHLDRTLLEWAQSLRALGNVGAHAGTEDVEAQDARDALEFARAVIDYVFAYKKKFAEFKARRTAHAARASQPASPDQSTSPTGGSSNVEQT